MTEAWSVKGAAPKCVWAATDTSWTGKWAVRRKKKKPAVVVCSVLEYGPIANWMSFWLKLWWQSPKHTNSHHLQAHDHHSQALDHPSLSLPSSHHQLQQQQSWLFVSGFGFCISPHHYTTTINHSLTHSSATSFGFGFGFFCLLGIFFLSGFVCHYSNKQARKQNKQASKQTNKQASKQTSKQASKQTNKQTSNQAQQFSCCK